jgi:DNA repair photolyase
MIVREVRVKSILSRSKIYDYVINPYTGCQHACSYCYARYMKRFSGHDEPWGQFVDVKINAADLLQREIKKKPMGRVWVSGVCDPYQPLEVRYKLTGQCLAILFQHQWPVTVQTRSALVLRDLELIQSADEVEVSLSIPTGEDRVRQLFEPSAPPIQDRLKALGQLHSAGIRTCAMIAPLLPGAESLPAALARKADSVLIDRMNYHYADWVYKKYRLENALADSFFSGLSRKLCSAFEKEGIPCKVLS